mgnify:CR=1 FL=1|jgi:hypothetical protein
MARYRIYNGAMPTTAKFVAVTTGTAIKTLLQLKPFNQCKIVAWGISFDGSAAATPIPVELLETGTVFATVTASVDADCHKLQGTDQAVASVAGLTMGTAATGYTASAEGTITVSRLFDAQLVAPTNQYIYQFPLGQEPVLVIGNACRIRVHAGAAVNAVCWIEVEI